MRTNADSAKFLFRNFASCKRRWKWQTTSAQYIVYMRLRPSPWMGPLLRMQTKLHFEDLPENEQVQYLQKIALRAENPSGPRYIVIWSRRIFCVSNFLLLLRQLIFRIVRRAIEAHRLQSIFTLSLSRIREFENYQALRICTDWTDFY